MVDPSRGKPPLALRPTLFARQLAPWKSYTLTELWKSDLMVSGPFRDLPSSSLFSVAVFLPSFLPSPIIPATGLYPLSRLIDVISPRYVPSRPLIFPQRPFAPCPRYYVHSRGLGEEYGREGSRGIPAYPSKQLSDSLCRCFFVLLSIPSSRAARNKGEVSLSLCRFSSLLLRPPSLSFFPFFSFSFLQCIPSGTRSREICLTRE